jgi:hypothetical protein
LRPGFDAVVAESPGADADAKPTAERTRRGHSGNMLASAKPPARAKIKRDRRPIIRRYSLWPLLLRAATGRAAPTRLEIAGDGLELRRDRTRRLALPVRRGVEAMVDMVMDQLPLGLPYGLFDGVKLLGEFKACPAFGEHHDDLPDMPFGALEPLDDFRMACVNLGFWRENILSPGTGCRKRGGGTLPAPL